ncbi:hypothetical protein PoB_000446300 [Plakobranchus ocellatus]|uniref:Uncharacterized protein n=1 Tax=Plakobranchus ocellatus TaxID=259542 RepID=A0AAV3Y5X8_9GAST|nr:hypothetical protein PoB_000446300 [Plakobranchus ocellatus]
MLRNFMNTTQWRSWRQSTAPDVGADTTTTWPLQQHRHTTTTTTSRHIPIGLIRAFLEGAPVSPHGHVITLGQLKSLDCHGLLAWDFIHCPTRH